MCEHRRAASSNAAAALSGNLSGQALQDSGALTGSRRRRLWELASHTHCPVIGVCIPMPVLRRLVGKALGATGNQATQADDYDFHAAAVMECHLRRPISEILQRELDRRYSLVVRRFAQAKTVDCLASLWREALENSDVAGALWATLSHPRCNDRLCEQVCYDIHMYQHQAGAMDRADLQRLRLLQEEKNLLAAELAASRERHAGALRELQQDIQAANAQLMRLRAQLIARESALSSLQDEVHELKEADTSLPQRMKLSRRLEELQRNRQGLLQERLALQQRAEQDSAHAGNVAIQQAAVDRNATQPAMPQDRTQAEAPADPSAPFGAAVSGKGHIPAIHSGHHARHPAGHADMQMHAASPAAQPALLDKSVLCVGGRAAIVPVYRQLIEQTGGRFIHHDGGEEKGNAQLEASLAAADLVICQAGCISHHAYWRVKDHCKRTGKQCVFVEKPSKSSFVRCLHTLTQTAELDAE